MDTTPEGLAPSNASISTSTVLSAMGLRGFHIRALMVQRALLMGLQSHSSQKGI